MHWLVEIALFNAVAATLLALMVAGAGRACRRPALVHGLWRRTRPTPRGRLLREPTVASRFGRRPAHQIEVDAPKVRCVVDHRGGFQTFFVP
jgi:hypothetical protein